MKRIKFILNCSFLFLILFQTIGVKAWEGMPTPPLHIEGNQLKDPTGKSVLLHGWMQPSETWFNGGGNRYSNPTDWTNPNNVAGLLNFLKDAATVMSDTTPKYGQNHGWHASFVRLNTDQIGGWTHASGLVDMAQFNGWINNFIVPYADHLRSRGLYLVICAVGPINTPDNGSNNTGREEQQRLISFWRTLAKAPGIRNADNIMFELMNEPVAIETSFGANDWGHGQSKYWKAFRDWMQPVINTIRNEGANNVIWVPTLGWQGEPQGWAQYPFSGSNIGVAAHYYPAYGGVHDKTWAVQNLWNSNYKPAADKWPMIITEMMWFPGGTGYDNLFNGTTAGFGNAVRKAIDNQGNVSYLVGFLSDLLVDLGQTSPQNCTLGSHEGAQSYFTWLPEYTWAAPDDGTPRFKKAYVDDETPNQIILIVNHAIKNIDRLEGFHVKIDNQDIEIEAVELGDTATHLVITLKNDMVSSNEISLSYNDGNITSVYDKNLVEFNNVMVYNLLNGAAPVLTNLETNKTGDTIIASFSKKMTAASDFPSLTLTANFDGEKIIPVTESRVNDMDSTQVHFVLEEQVYADYDLLLSYTGNTIVSSDSSYLQPFSDIPVQNHAQGLPVTIESGVLRPDGISVVLEFSKNLGIAVGQATRFSLNVNGVKKSIKDFYISENTVRFTALNSIYHGDIVKVSYSPGNVMAVDNGSLEAFNEFPVTNQMEEPEWLLVSSRIEAENYYLQSGTQTENTADVGGGLNVGYIDNGEWLLYAIDNDTHETEFEITYRIASPNNGGSFNILVNDKVVDQVDVPNTGSWQVWQSVVRNITLAPGKQYLKIDVINGGFNINYVDIESMETAINEFNTTNIELEIFPNPASDKIVIRSSDFHYNTIEIIDVMGKAVFKKAVVFEPEFHLPLNLDDGLYFLKISNNQEYRSKSIIIKNE
ncbi:carbohydrate-binding protein [Maribellus sediminis]|uniref:carbohydrate-binding protein n=1 Tax=Maribellus sediminis TaxID=2696285 RepID=UPI00142F6E70|nr:carbohydrate-binding protein [Maribellus sediminis]